MSKRAEQAAEKIHDRALLEAEKYAASRGRSIAEEVAYGRGFKIGFIEGYEQAEKDLALTWEDMELLHRLFAEEEDNFSMHDKYFYTEVLNRFNKSKEEKK